MNHINVSQTSAHPVSETLARLESFLHEFAPGAQMTITLRAPFDVSALKVGLTLQRDVIARFAPLGDDRRAYAIGWQPVAAGPFPAFAGTIFITENEFESNGSIVTLDGHYHPPMGVAGDVFDAIIGRHIAQASATDLLERITTYIDRSATPAPAPAFA